MHAGAEAVQVRVNGQERSAVSALDRGLAYGDGVFESMRSCHGRIPLLEMHLQRLHSSCGRLRIELDIEQVRREIQQLLILSSAAGRSSGVIKLIVTRGPGGRGYRAPHGQQSTRVLIEFPHQPPAQAWLSQGISLRYCDTRLGLNPQLAGIKHLNRLEQVLARSEWDDPGIVEGLMADTRGRIVEGISSNLFLVSGGRLITPLIEGCGVAGVMRRYIIEEAAPALSLQVTEMHCERVLLAGAQELFVCNAVQGVLAVNSLGGRNWRPGAVTRRVQEHVGRLFSA